MARYYKCEAFFNCLNRGWTETYYCDADQLLPLPGSGNPNNSANFVSVNSLFKSTVLTARALLSGTPVTILGTRISGVNRLVPGQTANNGSFIDYKQMPPVTTGQTSDNPPTTLVTTIYNATTSQKHQIHIRGVWDTIDQDGGQLIVTPAFAAAFASYAAAVQTAGWGWISRNGPTTSIITNYVATIGGAIEFTVAPILFGGVQPGAKVPVRVSSLNFGKSELNGPLTVQVVNGTTCVTVQRIVCAPFAEQGQMRFNAAYWVQNGLAIATKIGSRDTGGSLFLGVGRASKRVRY